MTLTNAQINDIWGTLHVVGTDTSLGEEIVPAALDWLIMQGFVESSEVGPQLTKKGQHAFKVLETGEGVVSEIDGPDFEN
jgi:hypothetical protein